MQPLQHIEITGVFRSAQREWGGNPQKQSAHFRAVKLGTPLKSPSFESAYDVPIRTEMHCLEGRSIARAANWRAMAGILFAVARLPHRRRQ
ncbi:hypothetical protein [Paracoccus sp. pheM1]|uniref:hypothetical protein n=1 Tax=Paracoccus sp. pheM1 TaxID=2831675 RepID=UPI001BDB7DE7|nr:hypothetical protein [Paracoccus sp. pheM1]MBT0780360.1 hypothetical protein [Paracoccus sp. pheM1]